MAGKQIPLRNRKGEIVDYALVSEEDYERVMTKKWNKRISNNSKRELAYALSNQGGLTIRMHQFVMGTAPDGMVIDHQNHNGLDNRRENLRFITQQQNAQNTEKRKGTSSQYKGVSYYKRSDRWRMQYGSGKDLYFTTFPTEIEAARAYDKYVLLKLGEGAKTNGLVKWQDIKDLNLDEEFTKRKTTKPIPTGISYRRDIGKYRVKCIYERTKYTSKYYKTLEEAIVDLSKYQEQIKISKQKKQEELANRPILRDADNIAIIKMNRNDANAIDILVDDEHWHHLMRYTWSYVNGYANTTIHKKRFSMHRYIMTELCKVNIGEKLLVDHINGIKHDNRTCNLRVNDRCGNSHNKKKNEGYASKFIGVSKNCTNWSAKIGKDGKKYYIGTYKTEKEAAEAYNKKAIELYGDVANLNVFN